MYTPSSYAMTFVPDPATLPEAVREAAETWEAAYDAIHDAEADVSKAQQHLEHEAPRLDGELLREAVHADKGDPGTPHRDEATQAVTAAERVRGVRVQDGKAAARALAEALREHRADLAAHIRPQIEQALQDYRAAVDTHAEAAHALTRVSGWLAVVEDLDRGRHINYQPTQVAAPVAAPASMQITDALERLDTPLPTDKVSVVSTSNGSTLHIDRDQARALVRSGYAKYVNAADADSETATKSNVRRTNDNSFHPDNEAQHVST